jgi:hypothetical protein
MLDEDEFKLNSDRINSRKVNLPKFGLELKTGVTVSETEHLHQKYNRAG